MSKTLLLASILALCVVVLGAYVRLSDAGLACPDWPGCYGLWTVPQSQEAIQKAERNYALPVHTAKAWREMLHRYLAGSLGLLILGLNFLALRFKNSLSYEIRYGVHALLLLVIAQALLGMWTVTLQLKPIIVTAHLLGGMGLLGALVWLSIRKHGVTLSGTYGLRGLSLVSLVLLMIQIGLGGWTSANYAALACMDFPTCQGSWWPVNLHWKEAFTLTHSLHHDGAFNLARLTTVQWAHRLGAYIVLLYMGFWVSRLWRIPSLVRWGAVILGLLVLQISIGIGNLLLHLPLVLALAHNFIAALLLVAVVSVNALLTPQIRQRGS